MFLRRCCSDVFAFLLCTSLSSRGLSQTEDFSFWKMLTCVKLKKCWLLLIYHLPSMCVVVCLLRHTSITTAYCMHAHFTHIMHICIHKLRHSLIHNHSYTQTHTQTQTETNGHKAATLVLSIFCWNHMTFRESLFVFNVPIVRCGKSLIPLCVSVCVCVCVCVGVCVCVCVC